MRLTIAALLMLFVACVTPNQHGPRFLLIEESYGLYEVQGRQTQLIQETMDVPCQLGTAFGVQMTLLLSDDSGGEISLAGELRTPPVEGVRPELKQITPAPFLVPSGLESAPFAAGYSFDRPEELVAGEYTLRFYDSETDSLLYKRTFHVSNCP